MRLFNYDEDLLKYYNKDSLKLPKNTTLLNKFLNAVETNLNIQIGDMLGIGFEGQVFEIKNTNKVIKFQTRSTDDFSDIETSLYLLNKKLNGIVNITRIGIVRMLNNAFHSICINSNPNFNEVYYIISDKVIVNNKVKQLFNNLEKDYNLHSKTLFGEFLNEFNGGDAFLGFIEDFFGEKSLDKYIGLTNYKNEVKRLYSILRELQKHEIDYNDFLTKNFGLNENNQLCLFDISGYEGYDYNINDLKVISI